MSIQLAGASIKKQHTYINKYIGGRGFPSRRIFPWARWGWGPGQIPELFGRRRRRRRWRRIFLKNAKTEIDDESYLEQILGIIIDGEFHSFFAAHFFF